MQGVATFPTQFILVLLSVFRTQGWVPNTKIKCVAKCDTMYDTSLPANVQHILKTEMIRSQDLTILVDLISIEPLRGNAFSILSHVLEQQVFEK